MSRGPWSAPPPPAIELESQALMDEVSQETSIHSNESQQGQSALPESLATVESQGGNLDSFSIGAGGKTARAQVLGQPSPAKPSQAMIIALTVAILLPPALLLGAIIGYLFGMK